MIRIFIWCIALILPALVFAQEATLIETQKVGDIYIGMPESRFVRAVDSRLLKRLFDPNNISKIAGYKLFSSKNDMEIFPAARPSIEVEFDYEDFTDFENRYPAIKIWIYDAKYKTEEGIGVGSRYKSLRETFPDIKDPEFINGILAIESEHGYIFYLDPDTYPSDWIRDRNLDSLSESIIDFILVL